MQDDFCNILESHKTTLQNLRAWYICARCGACCKWPGEVGLTTEDISRIAKFLKLEEKTFIEQYTQIGYYRTRLVLKESPDGACIFLEENRCKIYPVRPEQCKLFPNGWHIPNLSSYCKAKVEWIDKVEFERRIKEIFRESRTKG